MDRLQNGSLTHGKSVKSFNGATSFQKWIVVRTSPTFYLYYIEFQWSHFFSEMDSLYNLVEIVETLIVPVSMEPLLFRNG